MALSTLVPVKVTDSRIHWRIYNGVTLLQITNVKWHIAYQIMFSNDFSDLNSPSALVSLLKCFLYFIAVVPSYCWQCVLFVVAKFLVSKVWQSHCFVMCSLSCCVNDHKVFDFTIDSQLMTLQKFHLYMLRRDLSQFIHCGQLLLVCCCR